MEFVKITLHPLFIVLGIASAIFGGLPVFVIYVLTALLHECGHTFCAARLGFECSKIKLMPYGAAAVCETEGITHKDEILLAFSGPMVNAALLTACAALWWFFPETYTFSDEVFKANLVMLTVNLLPAYPLDGGRALKCVLCLFLSEKKANIILRTFSVLFGLAGVTLFVFNKNITLLIFALFLIFSVFEKNQKYLKLRFYPKKIKRGREVKHIMLYENSTYKDALKFLSSAFFCVFMFYNNGVLDEVLEDELLADLETKSIYDKILS